MKTLKFIDIKNRKQLKKRVVGGVLSVGCYWSYVRGFVSKTPGKGLEKITVIYSPGYGGTAEIIRYI